MTLETHLDAVYDDVIFDDSITLGTYRVLSTLWYVGGVARQGMAWLWQRRGEEWFCIDLQDNFSWIRSNDGLSITPWAGDQAFQFHFMHFAENFIELEEVTFWLARTI